MTSTTALQRALMATESGASALDRETEELALCGWRGLLKRDEDDEDDWL